MDYNSTIYKTYTHILEDELMAAMGCTEPIAVAYCAAKAADVVFGGLQTEESWKEIQAIDVKVSQNILKNAKSVVVPNTDGMIGIETATAAGIIFGKSEKELEVISEVSASEKENLQSMLKAVPIKVSPCFGTELLEIIVAINTKEHTAVARVIKAHTNLDSLMLDGKVIYQNQAEFMEKKIIDKSLMNVKDIYDYAKTARLEDFKAFVEKQIECNMAIAEEGMTNTWGANVGKTLVEGRGGSIKTKAVANAAAGSDARMSGCELPVVIVSGSGNQGITASVPVATYGLGLQKSKEEILRAVCFSDLIAIHEKTGIGPLSAFCGAVCAGSGAAAGIAFLKGCSLKQIEQVIITTLGITSGMVCDGAKPSCAAKIAASVDAAILANDMIDKGRRLKGGEGILSDDVEKTIERVGRLGRVGMAETDIVIQKIMTE